MLSVLCILCAQALFNFVLYNFINPELVDVVLHITLEKMKVMMVSYGKEGVLLQEMLIEFEKKIRNGYTLTGTIQGIVFFSIFFGIIALIVSAAQYKINPQKPNFN